MKREYDSYSIEHKAIGGYGPMQYVVYGFGTYPDYSVLAGQTSKTFLDSFDTLEEAQAAYPQAEEGYRDPCNHFNHLPGEDDPVEGGMYPDDIGADWSRREG